MDVIELVKTYEGIIEDDHFVYASGDHGSAWINKDALTPHAELMQLLCGELAKRIAEAGVECDIVAGPAMGGIIIAHWLGLYLDVPSVYLERDNTQAEKAFACHRGFDRMVKDARILLVDDVLNTGFSLQLGRQCVEKYGGEVVAMAALLDRGNATAETLACQVTTLATINMPVWPATGCPLCQQGVDVNLDFAHGREFIMQNPAGAKLHTE